MHKPQLNTKGFGLAGVLLTILVLVAVGGAGVYAYHRNHKAKTVSSNTGSSTTTKNPAPMPVDPYAGWKTYTAAAGGFTLKYPSDWYIADGGTGPSYGEITIEPASSQSTTSNAFRMTLRVGANQDASYQPSAASTGTVKQLTNGVNLWTTSESNAAAGAAVCPVMEIINLDRTHFSYKLADGQYLTLNGGYCQGQRDVNTYTYQQQLASKGWKTAVNILSSIRF